MKRRISNKERKIRKDFYSLGNRIENLYQLKIALKQEEDLRLRRLKGNQL